MWGWSQPNHQMICSMSDETTLFGFPLMFHEVEQSLLT